ncbi:WYL domain-containing protein [Dactylosporangium sp. NPDC050688]|uniref:helix-turn-helix transcriptional regulator n=1 Tax=Dactylosporangium sp. NPDC050688 TaxID=3157217 RepID=UPI0033FC6433
MLETSARLLRLLSLLQSRRDWSGADLADRLAVTTRTVRNDVERLRSLGYHIDSSTGRTGGYRLGAGTATPPLLLDDEEAVAVAVGLRAAAAGSVTGLEDPALRALIKLEQTLPPRLRRRVDALRSATVSAAGGGPTVDAALLTALAAATRDHERINFDYKDRRRRAEPHRLVYTGRRWYLLAWDVDRGDWRTFRADLVVLHTPTGPRFAPREPPGGDAVAHVLRGVASTAWRFPARIRLHAPIAEVTARLASTAGLLTPTGDATCELETGADKLMDLAGFLGAIGFGFTVLDPPELRDLLRDLAARYQAAAAEADG